MRPAHGTRLPTVHQSVVGLPPAHMACGLLTASVYRHDIKCSRSPPCSHAVRLAHGPHPPKGMFAHPGCAACLCHGPGLPTHMCSRCPSTEKKCMFCRKLLYQPHAVRHVRRLEVRKKKKITPHSKRHREHKAASPPKNLQASTHRSASAAFAKC